MWSLKIKNNIIIYFNILLTGADAAVREAIYGDRSSIPGGGTYPHQPDVPGTGGMADYRLHFRSNNASVVDLGLLV